MLVDVGPSRTPQGVRGLKRPGSCSRHWHWPSHSARSAWIETISQISLSDKHNRRTPQGVRGLKPESHLKIGNDIVSHSARSAWIETDLRYPSNDEALVALRKECVD